MHLFILDAIKLMPWLVSIISLMKPGYKNVKNNKKLIVPFAEWIKDRNLYVVDRFLNATCSVAYGGAVYSAFEDISMIYPLKIGILDLKTRPTTYFHGNLSQINEGYQEVWNVISKKHNIIFKSNITNISRDQNKIVIKHSGDETSEYDYLIIACNLTGMLEILDTTEEEEEIFSKVKHVGSWKAVFIAKDLPTDAGYVFLDQLESPDVKPALSGFIPEGQVGDGKYLYTTVLGLTTEDGFEEVIKNSNELLEEHFNASEIEWVDNTYWPEYHSHFESKEIKNGIFDKFELMQGKNNTFYVGEILSGISNGLSMDYSFDLVDRFFV